MDVCEGDEDDFWLAAEAVEDVLDFGDIGTRFAF